MRSRNIKPGFFANDKLAEVPPLGRLLFAGLWCLADREGRLLDRPSRIRGELLRYDTDADADALLDSLNDRGFILRYEAAGTRYIQVTAFRKHQNPHCHEKGSKIPAPCQHGAGMGPVSEMKDGGPADSGFLNPDSLILNPEEKPAPSAAIADSTHGGGITLIASNGAGVQVTAEMVSAWQKAYPDVSVPQQLDKMAAWLLSNPRKRKTAAGMPRFVNAWLSREQGAQHGPERATQSKPSPRNLSISERAAESERQALEAFGQ